MNLFLGSLDEVLHFWKRWVQSFEICDILISYTLFLVDQLVSIFEIIISLMSLTLKFDVYTSLIGDEEIPK